MQPWEYRGRWALVTGASAGIGAAFARELAARGMKLVLTARREERLRALAEALAAAHGTECVVLPADLATAGAGEVLWTQASTGRDVHLLVNDAGFGLKGAFADLPLDRQAEMLRLNCGAPMELMHLALAPMRARGRGGIVNVDSIAGFQPIPMMAAYAASKAFLRALSQAVAAEVGDQGVRVVSVSPGPVATEFQSVAGTRVSERTLGIRTPEQVVAEALSALERGATSVVPGLVNAVAAVAVRMAPRSVVLRAARRVMTKLR